MIIFNFANKVSFFLRGKRGTSRLSYGLDIYNWQEHWDPSSASISGLDTLFWLQLARRASTLALVLDKHVTVRLQFKFGSNFGLLSSTRASSFHTWVGLWCSSWLWRVLQASMCASAGAIIICWLGSSWHSRPTPAMVTGWRLNRELMGNLQQKSCTGSSAATCYYIMWPVINVIMDHYYLLFQ